MSRRSWWPGGRQRAAGDAAAAGKTGRAGDRDGPADDATANGPTSSAGVHGGLSPTGAMIAERVLAAATGGRDGVLQLVGDPGGLVHLAAGRVVLATTRAAPGLDLLLVHRTRGREGRAELLAGAATSTGRDEVTEQAQRVLTSGVLSPVEVEVLHQQAVADAAAALLAVDGTTLVRSRFVRGERPWTGLTSPLTVDDLVAEAARRRRVLTRLDGAPAPDARLARVSHLPMPAVRLSATQWDLVTLADGDRTVRDLARWLGRSLFATTLEVARLHRLGLLEPARGSPEAVAGVVAGVVAGAIAGTTGGTPP